MKSQFVTAWSVIIILCFSGVALAHHPSQDSTQSADILREKIEQLEKSDLYSRSATVREIYKHTLRRLYAEFTKALEDDISDLSKIQATIRGTQSESEVADQLKKLITERDVVSERLKTIMDDAASVAPKVSREAQPMLTTTAPASLLVSQPTNGISTSTSMVSSNPGRAANSLEVETKIAATPLLPANVQGNVTIKNKDGVAYDAKGVKVVLSQVGTDGTRTWKAETVTDANGDYNITVPAGAAEQCVVTASVADFSVEAPVTNSGTANLELLIRPMGEFSRAIVGLQQTGASSAKSTQRFFMDLTLSAPLPWGESHPFFGRRARMWGSARITSVPQQITSGVAEFAGAFAQKVGDVKVNELAQGVEFLVGGEYRLTGGGASRFGTFGSQTSTRFTISFIVGGGVITPFNPRDTIEIFKVFRDAPSLPSVPEGKEFIAFVSPDRDRFFRQYYGGFRLQTYYFDHRNPDIPLKRYPATLDITYGQNEAVTGGRFRGGVIRLEGFYPLPYDHLKFINLFGTALIKPTRTQITDPLILESAPTGTTVPANNVFLFTAPQINRDYYRIGVGIDLISLISKWRALQK
jgi:hypothetical protein